jgi:uncharacterized protein (UPF0332 family)
VNEYHEKLFERAREYLASAKDDLEARRYNRVASSSYYVMFYVATAMLNTKAVVVKGHNSAIRLFGLHFADIGLPDIEYHQWLIQAYNARLMADYDVMEVVTQEEAHTHLTHAQQFLAMGEAYLANI